MEPLYGLSVRGKYKGYAVNFAMCLPLPVTRYSRAYCAGPLSCALSPTNSPRHFDSGDYKLRPLVVYHAGNPRQLHVSHFTLFRKTRRFVGVQSLHITRAPVQRTGA
jgi:hypothetical protein